MKRALKRWAVRAIVAVIAGVVTWTLLQPREPGYKGVKLNIWLKRFDYVGSSLATFEPSEAVRAMGTNCVPFLLRRIQSKDSRLRQKLVALFPNQAFKLRHSSAQSRQWTAACGFWALGPRAEFAISELANLTTDPDYCFGAMSALSGMGAKAGPVLLQTLTNQNAQVRTRWSPGSGPVSTVRLTVWTPTRIRSLLHS